MQFLTQFRLGFDGPATSVKEGRKEASERDRCDTTRRLNSEQPDYVTEGLDIDSARSRHSIILFLSLSLSLSSRVEAQTGEEEETAKFLILESFSLKAFENIGELYIMLLLHDNCAFL